MNALKASNQYNSSESGYTDSLKNIRDPTNCRLILAVLFSLLSVVMLESVAVGNLLVAPTRGVGEPILFGQRRVGPNFSHDPRFPNTSGRAIDDVVADLLNPRNPLSADDLPITAFRHPDTGVLVSANTRTRATLAKAGLEPTNVDIVDLGRLSARERTKLLNRLQEQPIIPNAPLPGTRVPVTPTMSDHTVLDVIEILGGRR